MTSILPVGDGAEVAITGVAPEVAEAIREVYDRTGGRDFAAGILLVAEHPDSPLHPMFDWDDTEAARKWRLTQAEGLVRRVKVSIVTSEDKPPIKFGPMCRPGNWPPVLTLMEWSPDSSSRSRMLLASPVPRPRCWRRSTVTCSGCATSTARLSSSVRSFAICWTKASSRAG